MVQYKIYTIFSLDNSSNFPSSYSLISLNPKSMELLVWNPLEFQRLYNCSVYRVDDVPFGQRREYAISGISYILLFLIFEANLHELIIIKISNLINKLITKTN
jgi:hypothetical protein